MALRSSIKRCSACLRRDGSMLRLLVAARLLAAVALAGAERNGALPGPLPLFPADNWWNQDVSQAPVDARSAQFIAFINNGGTPAPASRLRRLRIAGQRRHLRLPVRRRRRRSAEARGVVLLRRRERRRRSRDRRRAFRSIRFPTRRSRSRTGSKAARRAAAIAGGDRHMLIVDRDNRHLYELFDLRWNGSAVDGGVGRVLRSRAPTRGGPRAGRPRMPRAWRFFPGSCATTRCWAPTRSATRFA